MDLTLDALRWDLIVDALSWLALLAGSVFLLIGALGIIRLPDMFSRMHGAGVIDTLGAGLILLGLMLQAGWGIVGLKLLLVVLFVFFTSPTTSHALARAALDSGLKPFLGRDAQNDKSKSKEEEAVPSKT